METNEIAKVASQVRRDIVRMVAAVSSGHPGGSLGCADFLSVLYFDTMNHDPSNFKMDGDGEDLFFLSNGHISPVWYSVLARSNYFPVPELSTFRRLASPPRESQGSCFQTWKQLLSNTKAVAFKRESSCLQMCAHWSA